MGGGTGGGGWCGGGMWNGSGPWGGTGMWGTGSGVAWLTNNPDALAAWLQLKADHVKAMQTWYDTYKADLTTPEAQQALHDLWTKFWNDMKSFYEQYGGGATWTCPSDGMWGGWDMGGMMGGHEWDATPHVGHRLRRLLDDEPSRRLRPLAHDARQADRRCDRLAAALQGRSWSSAAQTALQTMRAHHRTQVKSFYRHHHLSVTTSRMRYGAGGWMGLGGMWGGFGW